MALGLAHHRIPSEIREPAALMSAIHSIPNKAPVWEPSSCEVTSAEVEWTCLSHHSAAVLCLWNTVAGLLSTVSAYAV